MIPVRVKQGAMALFATLFLAGCATFSAANGTPLTRYYAAVADYNTAKAGALPVVSSPLTPVAVAEEIVNIVEAADEELRSAEALRTSGQLTDDGLLDATLFLQHVQNRLLQLVPAPGANRGSVEPNQAAIPAAAILLLVQVLAGMISGLQLSSAVRTQSSKHLGRIKELVENGEDPTEEEIASLLSEGDSLTANLRAALEARRGQ